MSNAGGDDLDLVHVAMQDWRQGDLITNVEIPLIYLADNELVATGDPLPELEGLHVRERVVEILAVVTQTCDIVRHPRQRPFIHLAPVQQLDGETARHAKRGTIPRFVPLPAAGEDLFVDLDLLTTVEKAAIYRFPRQRGFVSEEGRRDFAEGLGRNITRPALPDEFNIAMRPFVDQVRGKHEKENSDLGALFRDLYSIRVKSQWSDDKVATIYLLFDAGAEYFPVVGDEPPDPGAGVVQWWEQAQRPDADIASRIISAETDTERRWLWDRLVETWASRCSEREFEIDFEVLRLDEMSARDWVSSDALDLDYLSLSAEGGREAAVTGEP